ncbi:4-alpha-glucanotransferase [Mobilicoccus pelagius NBRC 104925]|uniref:4-alpha-glucanotransferase n=1 Tax=Mobilicoccus pelagius NBRC 104925 TaxID=1089455 RepID=H5UVC7_9MICO|nr:4-alpha-glucanotransferase [Mobilicoccus pelagius NBRC 104925]
MARPSPSHPKVLPVNDSVPSSSSELSPDLADLAHRHGVATEYWDWQGEHVTVSAEAIRAVLAALDVDASMPETTRAALAEADLREWRRRIPPVRVVTQGVAATVHVHVPHGDAVRVWVETEELGDERVLAQVDRWVDPREVDGRLTGEATFAVPIDLPLGWHTLRVEHDGEVSEGWLVVTPARLELPPAVEAHGAAGLMNQVYSVRSRRSWGVGDLADVAELGAWGARTLDSDFMLINPVHAAEPTPPLEASPYLPTSRRFVNPIYIRVEDVPEFAELPAEDRARVDGFAAQARRLNASDEIDRDTAWELKEQALRILFGRPMSIRRAALFEAYCEREGRGLVDFATWSALVRVYGGADAWPEDVQGPDSPGTIRVREEHADEVSFAMWLQWVLDTQLATAQRELRDAGMSVGVVQDLAVGVHPTGADAWSLASAFARGITVGAPPDPYNQRGQDWSQPPWRPDRLEELGYGPFRDMVRAAMRHSGGLRIDHIIGLFRLWWVPAGKAPLEGTYVRYDHDALIGILMLEAQRAGAVVVGEDLGTVEPWVRDYLAERGVLGTSILWFENSENGMPRAPEAYRRLCLASVTTHDLPPTAGYLTGEHMRIREELDLFTRPVEVERAEDDAAQERMMKALRMRGLVSDLGEDAEVGLEDVVEALHRYVSEAPARLVGIAVPDLVGDRRAMNQPGTHREYPNWCLSLAGPDRSPLMLEDIVSSGLARRLGRAVVRGDHAQRPESTDTESTDAKSTDAKSTTGSTAAADAT